MSLNERMFLGRSGNDDSGIERLQDSRSVPHFGAAPMFRTHHDHLRSFKAYDDRQFREEPAVTTLIATQGSPPLPNAASTIPASLRGGATSTTAPARFSSTRNTLSTPFSLTNPTAANRLSPRGLWQRLRNAGDPITRRISNVIAILRVKVQEPGWQELQDRMLEPVRKQVLEPVGLTTSNVSRLQELGVRFWRFGFSCELPSTLQRAQVSELRRLQRNATTYVDWRQISEKLDVIAHEAWLTQDESKAYEWNEIKCRLEQLRTIPLRTDLKTIADTLRAGLVRNIGRTCNTRLYDVSQLHTKKLIENYNETYVDLLKYVSRCESDSPSDASAEGMTIKERLDFFLETRHAYGRTALIMSGGGAMAIYHLGVVRTLMEHGTLPRVVAGSSGGSLIAAVVGCSTDKKLQSLMQPGQLMFTALALKPLRSLCKSLRNLEGVFDTNVLEEFVITHCGELTFKQAFECTHRVLNVTVTSTQYRKHGDPSDGSLLLNYMTTPHVLVYSAVVASCSIPGLFEVAQLLVLDRDGKKIPYDPCSKSGWCDGSVASDIPTQRLSELFNINHHIVSQINPWVAPFLNSSGKSPSEYGLGTFMRWLFECLKYIIYAVVRSLVLLVDDLGFVPRRFHWVVNFFFQKYTGDITLVPNIRSWNFPKNFRYVLVNPTEDHYEDCMLLSQQSTWPKVNFIRASCRIEQTLNTCVEHLRSRLQVQEEALRLELDLCASFQVKREREANRKIAELGMELEAVKRQLETALNG